MSTYAETVLATSGLVAFWRLNESSGEAKDSKGTHNGTYAGGVTLSQAGPIPSDPTSKSVAFNGTNARVTVPASAELQPAEVTVEAWIFPTSLVGHSGVVTSNKFSTKVGYELGFGVSEAGENKTLEFGSYNGTWHVAFDTTVELAPQWYYVVGVYNGSNVIFYRNGIELRKTAFAGPLEYNAAEEFLIAVDHTKSHFFAGRLSEVAIYNTALSSATISQHWLAAQSGLTQSLEVGGWLPAGRVPTF